MITNAMLLLVLTALCGAIVPSCGDTTSTGVAPSTKAEFVPVLEIAELQAPTSVDRVDDLIGHSSEWFFLADVYFPPSTCALLYSTEDDKAIAPRTAFLPVHVENCRHIHCTIHAKLKRSIPHLSLEPQHKTVWVCHGLSETNVLKCAQDEVLNRTIHVIHAYS